MHNRKNTVELLKKSPYLFMWLEHLISLNREKKSQTWTIFNFCHIRCCLSISPVCQRVDTISVVYWVFPLFMPSTLENAHHIICRSLFYEYIVTFNFSWKIYMWTLFFSLEGYFHKNEILKFSLLFLCHNFFQNFVSKAQTKLCLSDVNLHF